MVRGEVYIVWKRTAAWRRRFTLLMRMLISRISAGAKTMASLRAAGGVWRSLPQRHAHLERVARLRSGGARACGAASARQRCATRHLNGAMAAARHVSMGGEWALVRVLGQRSIRGVEIS
jgi:hypothetical protein